MIRAAPPASVHGRFLFSFRIGHLVQVLVDDVIKLSLWETGNETQFSSVTERGWTVLGSDWSDLRRSRGCPEQWLWSQSKWPGPSHGRGSGSPSRGRQVASITHLKTQNLMKKEMRHLWGLISAADESIFTALLNIWHCGETTYWFWNTHHVSLFGGFCNSISPLWKVPKQQSRSDITHRI